jgi:isoaspartyl peptidase/L-asparaginase-like protein (Ntn-hydrolase superfamily)
MGDGAPPAGRADPRAEPVADRRAGAAQFRHAGARRQHCGGGRLTTLLAVHGGAGTIRRADLSPKQEARYRAALERSLEAGYKVLKDGGASVDAVVAAIVVMEDSPLFNAGRGAVYNAEGRHELDAAVMDGASLSAGAVACVRRIKNPILAARAVMQNTEHVLLACEGAERFARRMGLPMAAPGYFDTRRRLAALKNERRRRQGRLAGSAREDEAHGTVGAVAVDQAGNLAAGTSTGGVTGKLPGRVGDSPIVGAGTYADNETCAVSGSGWGEMFIRAVLAHDVAARMRYLGEPLARAASGALAELDRVGGDGGLIAIDRRGRVAMPFNTEGMYRGWITRDGETTVAIYR